MISLSSVIALIRYRYEPYMALRIIYTDGYNGVKSILKVYTCIYKFSYHLNISWQLGSIVSLVMMFSEFGVNIFFPNYSKEIIKCILWISINELTLNSDFFCKLAPSERISSHYEVFAELETQIKICWVVFHKVSNIWFVAKNSYDFSFPFSDMAIKMMSSLASLLIIIIILDTGQGQDRLVK